MSKITDAIHTLSTLEELASAKSPIHCIHPGIKIVFTFVYLISVVSLERHLLSPLISLFVFPAILIPLAGIPFSAIFKRVLVALPFSLFAGISNILFERNVLFHLIGIPVTDGMLSFAAVMVKTFLCVSAVLVLIATTPSFTLFLQLRKFHIPKVLVLTLMMTYRYIFLLLEEVGNMTQSYHLRAPEQKGIQMKDMGTFLAQLIFRCFDRSERIYNAMECRGFTGEYCCASETKIIAADLLWGAGFVFFILFLRFLSLPRLIEMFIF